MSTQQMLDSRYQVLRTIGSGGMGVVYLVIDSHKENKIMALKVCKAIEDPDLAENFRSEFRNILGVRHPHIPEVYDFGNLPDRDGALYFTCEFVDGQPLDTLCETWEPEQLRFVLVTLCRALAFLHSRSMLHRDIKPENVLGKLSNDPDKLFEQLKLVDFGLASSGNDADMETGGTLGYLAPEIIEGSPATIASDLYATGMLMYRLAVSRFPFDGDDPVALARQRTRTEAPSPLRYRPDLPVGLADVISSLIERKPVNRPPSARHVIALLNEREGTDHAYETTETSRAYLRSATSVTHPAARNRLADIRQSLAANQVPQPLLIRGWPGLGRTRLVSEFATELTLAGIPHRTIETDADLPVSSECPRALLVPEVAKITPEILDNALSDLPSASVWWLLGINGLNESTQERFLSIESIDLKPLSANEMDSFVQATFPENSFPPEFTAKLYTNSVGLPAALQRIFDHLQEQELLTIGVEGWELLPGDWNLPEHPNIKQLVDSTVVKLSRAARDELSILTCSTTPLPVELLERMHRDAGRSESDIQELREALDGTGWITKQDSGASLQFVAVRRAIMKLIATTEILDVHRRLNTAWNFCDDCDPALRDWEIVYHDFRSQSWESEPEQVRQVLRHVPQQVSMSDTRNLLKWARCSDPPAHLRNVIYELLSRAEYESGDLKESAAVLQELLNPDKQPIHPGTIHLTARYATLQEKLGHTEIAERLLKQCLDILPEDNSSTAGSIYGTLAWIAFKKGEQEVARRLAEDGLVRMPADAADPGFALLLNTFATLAFYRGDGEVAAGYWQRCLEVSEKLGDRKNIANMYNNLGVLAAQSGDRICARSLWEQCAEISREINDTHRLAGIYNNLGVDALETGSFRDAEEYYLKSLMLFRRMQSPREQVETLSNLGELAFYRADYPRAMAYFRESVGLAVELDDRECQVEPLVYLGKLQTTLEQLEAAEQTLNSAREIAHEIGVRKGEGQAWEGLAFLYARSNRAESAEKALENAHKLIPNDVDPLAALHLDLTECKIAAEKEDREGASRALANAREAADTKWDPFTAARTEVYGLLFAEDELDIQRAKLAQRRLAVFPEFLWNYHWAAARRRLAEGSVRMALDEFGRGVSVLKAITSRLPDEDRTRYLSSPSILHFKEEAVNARKSLKQT